MFTQFRCKSFRDYDALIIHNPKPEMGALIAQSYVHAETHTHTQKVN